MTGPLLVFPAASWPGRPDGTALADLSAAAGLCTASGRPVRFVAPQDDGFGYERRIWERGEVETRPDNWHDFFNALVWLAFPRAKAALNACHLGAMVAVGRGAARDALTHFDECGLVAVSADPELLALLRGFRWKELFWEKRTEVLRSMRFFVFGHATWEQLLAPFRGVTAKAVLYDIEPDWLGQPTGRQIADLDARLAATLTAGALASPRQLQPVPLLGIPGLTPDSEDASYYDDIRQFRPGRRAAGV